MADRLTEYAIRTTDKEGRLRYFGGRGLARFGSKKDSLLSTSTLFKSRGSAQSIINNRKCMSPTGDSEWLEARDMWTRAEIVAIEVSFTERGVV